MKRLVINKDGEVSYGPKLNHIGSSSGSKNDNDDNNNNNNNDEDLHSPAITNQDQIPKMKKRVEVTVKDGELMYAAAFQGDWVAAEVLLERDPNLAFDYVTEEGDRALHVAVAAKRKEFVENLVGRMRVEDLALLDGHGNTAGCYAAISGDIKIACLIIGDRPNLVTARDDEKVTPLRKAALPGNRRMLSFLLGYAKDEDLSREEWFDLLLVAIRSKMFGMVRPIDILGKKGSIATMANEEGTALHTLARFGAKATIVNLFSLFLKVYEVDLYDDDDYKPWKVPELAKKLWEEMLKMEKASLVEVMKKPKHIVLEAAKTGQVHIINLLTLSFPKLIWETDSNSYTVFHMAVMYRKRAVFDLVHLVRPMLGSRTTWQDQQGNNILHLAAAESAAVTQVKLTPIHKMQRELEFFQAVKKIVPPSCLMMRNGKGLTPEELFTETHSDLMKESKVSMTNRADSLILIATILLTVVFAAAFTVPGGYSSQTGEPVLAKKNWFQAFVVFEVLSIMFSIASIIMFQSIMASSFAQADFLILLPALQTAGFQFLLISLICAFLAFMASILLFNISMSGFVWFGFVMVCIYGVLFWFSFETGM